MCISLFGYLYWQILAFEKEKAVDADEEAEISSYVENVSEVVQGCDETAGLLYFIDKAAECALGELQNAELAVEKKDEYEQMDSHDVDDDILDTFAEGFERMVSYYNLPAEALKQCTVTRIFQPTHF